MTAPFTNLTSVHGRRMGLTPSGAMVLNKDDGSQEVLGHSVTVTVTSAQLLALNATPQPILAAQGTGFAILPKRVAIRHAAGTAYAGIAAGEDLVLKYTNGSGAQCSSVIETTGFLDQTTAQIRVAHAPASTGSTAGDYAPVANAAVVLHLLSGEITTGDFDLIVKLWYDVLDTSFPATGT